MPASNTALVVPSARVVAEVTTAATPNATKARSASNWSIELCILRKEGLRASAVLFVSKKSHLGERRREPRREANPRREVDGMGGFSRIAFTSAVKAEQERTGSRATYSRVEQGDQAADSFGPDEIAFVGERDSFYMASVGESGWPYIQHRGGRKGFVSVLDERTIAFPDLRGNRQYISVGNVAGDGRVALILIDYPNRARLKILAHAKTVTQSDDPETFARVAGDARAERVFVLRVVGFDWNCPKQITPRFTEDEVRTMTKPLIEKLEALERENRELQARLEAGR